MYKTLEVIEFDSIMGNPAFEKDKKYVYLEDAVFPKLIDFIHEYTGEEWDSDALDFMKISYKRNVGNVVTIKNYVGLIQLKNGFKIEILPKISFTKTSSEKEEINNNEEKRKKELNETKKVFLKMLKSMKNFPCKNFNFASLNIDKMNLYEIFISMYIQDVRQLVKKGIKSSYVGILDNLNYYKGKLITSHQIKHNIVHKERFYVSYDEFHPNTAENRLVKTTLLKLLNITNSLENSKEIRQLLLSFEMVDPSINYEKDFSLVSIDRNTKDYEMLIQWSKIFLFNKSFTTFSGKTESRAILFPMESVYESYVAQQIKKILLPQEGWEISCQDKGKYLFIEPRKLFSLRPDIVCRNGKRTIVMDTKWKKLINDERKNYGISQSDMYQMYAYSKKYETSEIWLLYPIHDEIRNLENKEIYFKSIDKNETTVHVFFVDVANILNSLYLLKNKLNNNA